MKKTAYPLILLWIFAFSCTTSNPNLRIYSALDPEQIRLLVDLYAKETGESVEFIRLSSGETLTRVRTESKNPNAGLWLGGPSVDFAFAADKDLFEPYQPNAGYEIKKEYRDPEWRWTGLYLGPIGFASNKDFLKKHGISAPRSWQDLLAPPYKGKVSMALPYTSGTAMMTLLAILKVMGEPAGEAYIKKLDGQIHLYTKSGSACINQVGLGEVGACIAFAHDIFSKGITKEYPIELSFPSEGTSYEIAGLALIKNGQRLDKAKRFADWLHQPSAQRVFSKWGQSPLNPQVNTTALPVKMNQLKLVDVDSAWVSKNSSRIIETWRTITGK